MPYIPQPDRPEAAHHPVNAGELTFAMTVLVINYIRRKGLRYQTLCEVQGALQCTSQELYRRVIAPYEDRAAERNGDVYGGPGL